MSAEDEVSSDKFTLKVKDGKLYVDDKGITENNIYIFWKEIIALRYKQLESDSLPLVDTDESDDLYTVLKRELTQIGVIYKGNLRLKHFDEQSRDFMIGKNDKGILEVRQINGPPMTEDETRLNNFFVTMIKATRHRQLGDGSEKIPKNSNINDIVDKEIKRGIILNGNYISADILFAKPTRSRRR